jgi:magnesium chelatase subunit D
VLLAAMAERMPAGTAARLAATLDQGTVRIEREGLQQQWPARLALLLLDEGSDDDAPVPAALCDRVAFVLDLRAVAWCEADEASAAADAPLVDAARERLPRVSVPEPLLRALCGTALQLGVESLRAAGFALRAARAAAALAGRGEASEDDAKLAAALVLVPRATRRPELADEPPAEAPPPEADAPPAPPPAQAEADAAQDAGEPTPPSTDPQALEDRLVGATAAALPTDLLAQLLGTRRSRASASAGRVGQATASARHGRPVGSRRGLPRNGARLDLLATLRAAAPWQTMRRRAAATRAPHHGPVQRPIHVHPDDLHIRRLEQRAGTATLFVIDASGSSALHRLAEAKGAVNLLLADCYVRRDEVGVIAFRHRTAEVLLPPTRSLVRAKRSLAALPGGGGTPLAAGLQAALHTALHVRRGGTTPVLVLLTDGRANIALDGSPGRPGAEGDALLLARHIRAAGLSTLVIDTSAQPAPQAQRLADALGAQYRALPHAGASMLQAAVKSLAA